MKTIVYACDDNYSGLTAISAVSLLKYNPQSKIILLGYRLKDSSIELIASRVRNHGGIFQYIDLTENLSLIASHNLPSYTSYAIYSRLFIADILSNESGRILYLDCDTLVLGSLDELFALPMNGKPFAFGYDCISSVYKRFVKIAPSDPYYNSGVMLTDLNAWRMSGATKIIMEELVHPKGPNPLPDQDIISRAWKNYITPISPKWNFLSQYFLFDYHCVRRINGYLAPWATEEEYIASCNAPIIYHFSGHTLGRPWFTSSKHPMRPKYIESAQLAGLPEIAQQSRPMDMCYAIQYWLWKLLPQRLFDIAAMLMIRTHILLTYKK